MSEDPGSEEKKKFDTWTEICCQLDPQDQSSVRFQSKHNFFAWEYTFQNAICKMAAILSVPQCVDKNTILESMDNFQHIWQCLSTLNLYYIYSGGDNQCKSQSKLCLKNTPEEI